MCFSANLKKCLASLMLAGVAGWFAGCSDTASTPTKPTTNATPPKMNEGGDATAGNGSGSSSDESKKPAAADDEQAGSSTGGREVPEATP